MIKLSSLFLAAGLAFAATGASAQTSDNYRVNANSTDTVNVRVCEAASRLAVVGDGDTDLDFRVENSAGEVVHSDFDSTDLTFATLRPSGEGCENFTLSVINLGNVYNAYEVRLRPMAETRTSASGDNDGKSRDLSIRNRTGEVISYIYWSNTASESWGSDKLGTSSVLATGQDWNVNVNDGSNACRFDFKAETASGRTIERRDVDACAVFNVTFE
ncbi:MAG: hypothetical protein ABJP48_11350 [Erythrobacter sp.]